MFFFYYIDILMTRTDDFPKISDHFPKISEDSPRLPKIAGDFRGNPKMFRSYTNEFKYKLRDKLDISESIDILTSEDMENTRVPDVVSYEFYEWCISQ